MSELRNGLKLADAAIAAWKASTDDPPPAWCVTNAFLQAISSEEGISIGELVAELEADQLAPDEPSETTSTPCLNCSRPILYPAGQIPVGVCKRCVDEANDRSGDSE